MNKKLLNVKNCKNSQEQKLNNIQILKFTKFKVQTNDIIITIKVGFFAVKSPETAPKQRNFALKKKLFH